MKTLTAAAVATSAALAAVLFLPSQAALAQGAAAKDAPAYTPPQRGAPKRRVGGSSRGPADALPTVMLLVPDHVGLTVSENPPLYWYLSRPTSVRVEITLIDDKGEQPLIEYAVANANGPAVHRIDLKQHKVSLKPDVEYQWSIAVVPNPNERSGDVMSAGVVKRVAPPQGLATQGDRVALARAYAARGIWYDAIAIYSELIEQQPNDRALRESRAALLEQVGLKDVAAYDRRP